MAIGDYVKTPYNNGTTPAINAPNMNNNEDKTQEIDDGLADGTVLSTVEANIKELFAKSIIYGI